MSVPFGPAEPKNRRNLEALAAERAKPIKTEQDMATLSRQLLKLTVESALNGELTAHLGYDQHAPEGHGSGNSRNGYSPKPRKGDLGEVEIRTPRDRNGTFEPPLIRKGQTRLTEFDEPILALYARGMTTRDLAATFQERYGAEVSHGRVAKVTEAVGETVQAGQSRPLDEVLPDRVLRRDRDQGASGPAGH